MSIKYVSKHYIKHVNNKQEFENSVSLQQVFKHHNCSLFQFSLNVFSGYFHVSVTQFGGTGTLQLITCKICNYNYICL